MSLCFVKRLVHTAFAMLHMQYIFWQANPDIMFGVTKDIYLEFFGNR